MVRWRSADIRLCGLCYHALYAVAASAVTVNPTARFGSGHTESQQVMSRGQVKTEQQDVDDLRYVFRQPQAAGAQLRTNWQAPGEPAHMRGEGYSVGMLHNPFFKLRCYPAVRKKNLDTSRLFLTRP